MYILCVYALCVTLQELTSIFNCESDVTGGFFEWFIDSKESNWWVGNRMLVSNFAFATTGGRFCILNIANTYV